MAVTVAAAAILCFAPHSAVADRGLVPSREELRKKPVKELKAILRSRGAKCHKCKEKDEYVFRVEDTWTWAPVEAASPDGKVSVTKGEFVNQLKESYRKTLSESSGSGGGGSGGHELEKNDLAGMENMPDFNDVWAEFSERLQKGDIEQDANGQLLFDVGDMHAGKGTFWEKYKMYGLITLNLGLMFCMQRVRRTERAAQVSASDNIKSPPGPRVEEIDDDDDDDACAAGSGERDCDEKAAKDKKA